MKSIAKLLLFVTIVLAPLLASAQSTFSSREDGFGALNRGTMRHNLTRAEVHLERTGRATLTVRDRHRVWTFRGIWHEERGGTGFTMDIREAYDDLRARGNARIGVRGGRLVSIGLANGFADGASFRISFEANWLRGNRFGGGVDLTERIAGRGSFRSPIQSREFREVRFEIRRDGAFTIVMGDQNIRGFYRRQGNNLILELDSALRLDRVSGSGSLALDHIGRSVESFNFSGSSRQGRFSGNWRRDPDRFFDGRSFSFNQRGGGDLRIGDDRSRFRHVEAEFERNGRFAITFETDRGEFEVEGSWERRDSRTLVLDIRRAGERNANGTGTVDLDRNGRLERLTVAGEQLIFSERVRFSGAFSSR